MPGEGGENATRHSVGRGGASSEWQTGGGPCSLSRTVKEGPGGEQRAFPPPPPRSPLSRVSVSHPLEGFSHLAPVEPRALSSLIFRARWRTRRTTGGPPRRTVTVATAAAAAAATVASAVVTAAAAAAAAAAALLSSRGWRPSSAAERVGGGDAQRASIAPEAKTRSEPPSSDAEFGQTTPTSSPSRAGTR